MKILQRSIGAKIAVSAAILVLGFFIWITEF